MSTEKIKQMLGEMDNAFVQGHVYRLSYTVSQQKTDAYYDHNRALIKLIDSELEKAAEKNVQDANDAGRNKRLLDLKKSYQRQLGHAREFDYSSDYSVDGVGFYLKQIFSFVTFDGKKVPDSQSIYVSDGKILGVFYPDSAQAVIQPATERPQVPTEYWTDITYRFFRSSISEYCAKMQTLEMSESDGKIVIEGDRPGREKERTHLRLQMDKASLLPEKLDSVYYTVQGTLDTERVKTWEYQDVAGTKWPKVVVDQEYRTDLSGRLNLESEQKFTVIELSLIPKNAKEELALLLKSNYSVFDQIAGTRYISGNPAGTLDKLSQ